MPSLRKLVMKKLLLGTLSDTFPKLCCEFRDRIFTADRGHSMIDSHSLALALLLRHGAVQTFLFTFLVIK